MIDDLVQLTCTCKIIFSTLISLFFCFGVNFTTKPDQVRSLKLCFISLFVKVIGSIRFYYLIARVVYYLKQKESKPKKIIWRQLCNLGRTKEICSQEYKIDFSRLLRNFFWKTKWNRKGIKRDKKGFWKEIGDSNKELGMLPMSQPVYTDKDRQN